MNSHNNRFRKRPYRAPRDKSLEAKALRRISEDVSRRNFAQGLGAANAALGNASISRHQRGRLLGLVADSEFKRGAFNRAAGIYLQAANHCLDHHELWLRPLIGNVRALVKDVQVEQALIMARHAVKLAEDKQAGFDARVRQANRRLAEEGRLEVPHVPPRVSVVATRLGYLFLGEGEPEAAGELFKKALETNPRGAARARQGLARVALAMDNPGKAFKLSVDSIRRGRFGAKTLSSWPILIAARRQLGGWMVSERLINGLEEAPASVRARAVLIIVRELRKSDMRQWRQIAHNWSAREGDQFPIIEAEMRKMILASWKTTPGHAIQKRKAAQRLLETPGLSPSEWLAGAKEYVRAGLWEGRDVEIDELVRTASDVYGGDFAARVIHSLALSCMMAKRHDIARDLLNRNIRGMAEGSSVWGKSVWALARMESLFDQAESARFYRKYWETESLPVKFRLQAQLRWAKALLESGQTDAVIEARPHITAVLAGIEDPETLMNFARQMSRTTPELASWVREIFDRGADLALQQFRAADRPAVALDILFKLTRRQVYDFGRSRDAIQLWESFDDRKRDWLWSTTSLYWEYLGLLVRAYERAGQMSHVDTFAQAWLDDPATPPEGRIHVGIPFGLWLVRRRRMTEALDLFARLVEESPTHPLSAHAWYWLSLAAIKEDRFDLACDRARRIRIAQGLSIGMLDEWDLDAKALLIIADLDPAKVDSQAVNHSPERLQSMKRSIERDLAVLQ